MIGNRKVKFDGIVIFKVIVFRFILYLAVKVSLIGIKIVIAVVLFIFFVKKVIIKIIVRK